MIPDLIIQADPGDLFVLRNLGNFVPPFKVEEDCRGTGAGIEDAVSVLKVKETIICGHTHCGACKALYETIDNPELADVKKCLDLGEKAKSMAILSISTNADKEELLRISEKLSIVS